MSRKKNHRRNERNKRSKRDTKAARPSAVVPLLGLGAAAVVAGFYIAGKRREERAGGAPPGLRGRPRGGFGGRGRSAASGALEVEAPPPTPLTLPGPAGRLAVMDAGDGEPAVVFVHGLAGDLSHWRAQLTHLWPRHRAVAIDLRGHGASQEPADGDYGLEALAADLAATIETLGIERSVLVGHSLGAAVATVFAAERPELVAGLVLVDPNGDQSRLPAEQVEPFLAALRSDARGELGMHFRQVLADAAPGTAEAVMSALDATPPAALAGALESAARLPLADRLAAYEGPKLSLISSLNTLPISLHNLLPELPVAPVVGASHWLMLDRPDRVNQLLDEFLLRLSSGAQ